MIRIIEVAEPILELGVSQRLSNFLISYRNSVIFNQALEREEALPILIDRALWASGVLPDNPTKPRDVV